MLKGKHILLGITGSIAAYKAALLVRLLVKEGAEVKVIMTETAKKFITPLTMATLSKNPILVEFFNPENGEWNSHISLGTWADLYLIAPATANTMAKMANGVADNLLLTTYLSSRCPVAIAPAMDLDMFAHPATQNNISILKERGVIIIEPSSGELASGLDGKGRMEEPEVIVSKVKTLFLSNGSLSGLKVLITGGPTKEEIDPVRYISNHSSGKMAFSLAKCFADRGASVELVMGPVSINLDYPGVKVTPVVNAAQMLKSTESLFDEGTDITVLCAAVADFTPLSTSSSKIKRGEEALTIQLKPTADIAARLGLKKKEGTLLVGFALETEEGLDNAKEKLRRKNLDMIVLNSLKDKGAGFAGDSNKISLIFKDGNVTRFGLKSKVDVAKDIVDNIEMLLGCSKD